MPSQLAFFLVIEDHHLPSRDMVQISESPTRFARSAGVLGLFASSVTRHGAFPCGARKDTSRNFRVQRLCCTRCRRAGRKYALLRSRYTLLRHSVCRPCHIHPKYSCRKLSKYPSEPFSRLPSLRALNEFCFRICTIAKLWRLRLFHLDGECVV